MALEGQRIGVLIETDYRPEIEYYRCRFPEEGADVRFMSHLWPQDRLTFMEHEHKAAAFPTPEAPGQPIHDGLYRRCSADRVADLPRRRRRDEFRARGDGRALQESA